MAFPARATNGFYELIDRLDHVYDTNFGKSEISATKEEENYRKMNILIEMPEHLAYKRMTMIHSSLNPNGNYILNHRQSETEKKIWKFFQNILELRHLFAIWNGQISKIEGRYGSGVGSYFRLWNFLLNLNVIITLFPCFIFVIIPQLISDSTSMVVSNSTNFQVTDIITGSGYLEDTVLFYGAYTNNTVQIGDWNYQISSAYFYTVLIVYMVTFITIAIRMAKLFRKNFIQAQISSPNEFCEKVFGSWDFAVKESAGEKYTELRTQFLLLLDKRQEEMKEKRSFTMTKFVWTLTWLGSLACIAATGYGTYVIIDKYNNDDNLMVVSITITCFVLGIPYIFILLDKIPSFLKEKPSATYKRMTMYQSLFKTIILELTIIIVLMTTYLKNDIEDETSRMIYDIHTYTDKCWETDIGQQIYRLLLLYFIGIVLVSFLIDTLHKLLATWFSSVDPPEFDIASNTMHLIYGQTLAWLAIYYSPMSSVIFVIILLLIFFINMINLNYNCKISTKPWRAAQTVTIFFGFTFLSLLAASALFFLAIRKCPSKSCGPYQEEGSKPLDEIENIEVVRFILSPGVISLALACISVLFFYMMTNQWARRSQVKELKLKLKSMKEDNDLLIFAIKKIAKLNDKK